MNDKRRAELEKALKGANRTYWINFVCILINLAVFVVTKSWFPLVVGAVNALAALAANGSTKLMLRELGREEKL